VGRPRPTASLHLSILSMMISRSDGEALLNRVLLLSRCTSRSSGKPVFPPRLAVRGMITYSVSVRAEPRFGVRARDMSP